MRRKWAGRCRNSSGDGEQPFTREIEKNAGNYPFDAETEGGCVTVSYTHLDVYKRQAYKIYDVEAEKYVEMIVRYPKKEVVSVFRTNEEGYLIIHRRPRFSAFR